MRSFMYFVSSAVLLANCAVAQNFYHSESGPPSGFPGSSIGGGGGGGGPSPYGFGVPTSKPSRPSFFRNPLAAASSLHKTVIAGIRAPAFLSNLLPSASAPRPSFFSFAKPPRGFPGAPGPSSSYGSSFSAEAAASNPFPAYFGRPQASGPPPSFYGSSSGPSSSAYGGLPPNVISALQSGQFDTSSLGGDQQEAATNVHEMSAGSSPYDRIPPRIRPGYSGSDDSDMSGIGGSSGGSFDASAFASQGSSGPSVAQTLLAQQSASAGPSIAAPSSIAGYDIGVPVQLGFQSHSSDQSSQGGANSIGPAYQIDTSSLQYPSSYQQSAGQSGQTQSLAGGYSGLATGYGASDSGKQGSGYYGAPDASKQGSAYGQTYVVGSSLSYDGKTPSTSYSSPGKQTPEYTQGGYTGYSGSGSGQSNEALVQALKAYANGNVKYVPGKPAVPINHQLQHGGGHATSTSYSTSSSSSTSSYASPVSSKGTKYASPASTSGASYSSPVKSSGSYSSPVKASSIRYTSNSGGLSYAESSPQATKYGQKSSAAPFESTRTVGSSLKFADSGSSSASAGAASAAAKKASS